jgi:hypothetical protein
MTSEYLQKINFIKADRRFQIYDVFDDYQISLIKISNSLKMIQEIEKSDYNHSAVNNFYLLLFYLDKANETNKKTWYNIYKDKVFLKSHIRKLKYEKILVE